MGTRAERGIFYGWWVLAASVVIELFGLGFGIFAITTVYPYVIESFPDWPRTTVFWPTTIIIATVGLMSPLTGMLVDRVSIRRVFVAGITIQSLGLYALGRITTPAEYAAASLMVGVGMSGVTILPNQVLVARWFHERVGLVNGILLAATAMGAAVSPPLVTRIIEAADWRTGFQWIAFLAFAPPMVVALGLVRDRPSDLALRPYGTAPTAPPTGGFTLRDAATTVTFWALAAAVFLNGLPCYSFNKHVLVFLREAGFDAVTAADTKGLYFFVSGCSRLSFGWLCDRYDRRRMTLAHMACIAAGYPLILAVPSHPALLVPCIVVVGIGYGGLLPAVPILAVHYFGRRHLGTILGIYKIPYDVAAASAPLFTAWLYDLYGGYAVPERWNSAFAWLGLAIAALGLGRGSFVRPTAPETAAAASPGTRARLRRSRRFRSTPRPGAPPPRHRALLAAARSRRWRAWRRGW
jgi:MFS family permease